MADRYNPKVIEHLVRPRHVGEVPGPSGVGESGDGACGDVARFSVRIEANFLTEVRYKVYGCAASIAAGSALSELVNDRPLLEAARVSKEDVQEALGGPLPAGQGARADAGSRRSAQGLRGPPGTARAGRRWSQGYGGDSGALGETPLQA